MCRHEQLFIFMFLGAARLCELRPVPERQHRRIRVPDVRHDGNRSSMAAVELEGSQLGLPRSTGYCIIFLGVPEGAAIRTVNHQVGVVSPSTLAGFGSGTRIELNFPILSCAIDPIQRWVKSGANVPD